MSRNEAETLCAEMNQCFARHDAEIRRYPRSDTDIARKHDATGQAIKSRIMQNGWRLRCDQHGKFTIDSFVGKMVVPA